MLLSTKIKYHDIKAHMSILELKDISVVAGDKPLLAGVSLSIESGKVHVLMGGVEADE